MSASDHMERVASCPCVLCWKKLGKKTYGVHVHHAGPVETRSDWLVVSLCPEHHTGPTGVHGAHRREFERMWKVDDFKLLAWTNEALQRFA